MDSISGFGMVIRHIQNLFNRGKEEKISKDLSSLRTNVLKSFEHLKKDIKEQKRWIDNLHHSHKELDGLSKVLHEKHDHHNEIHAKDIDNINRWIDHLHDLSKDQEKYMKDLEKNISSAFERYNKYLVDIYRIVADQQSLIRKREESVQARPEMRLDAQTEASRQKKDDSATSLSQTKTPIGQGYDDGAKPISYYSDILTHSEKRILAELCNTDMKLSYKDLAVVLGVSPNTAKNHVCHIRNKGFPIKEADDSKGVKRYYVPDNMKKVLLSKNL